MVIAVPICCDFWLGVFLNESIDEDDDDNGPGGGQTGDIWHCRDYRRDLPENGQPIVSFWVLEKGIWWWYGPGIECRQRWGLA